MPVSGFQQFQGVFFKTAKPVDNAAAPIALAANIRRHPGLFVHAQRARWFDRDKTMSEFKNPKLFRPFVHI